MDQENSGSPGEGTENIQPTVTGVTVNSEHPLSTTAESGAVVDKTLAEIKDGVVKDIETTVRHKAHDILDEMEQHLSALDAHVNAAWHAFVQRLRHAL